MPNTVMVSEVDLEATSRSNLPFYVLLCIIIYTNTCFGMKKGL